MNKEHRLSIIIGCIFLIPELFLGIAEYTKLLQDYPNLQKAFPYVLLSIFLVGFIAFLLLYLTTTHRILNICFLVLLYLSSFGIVSNVLVRTSSTIYLVSSLFALTILLAFLFKKNKTTLSNSLTLIKVEIRQLNAQLSANAPAIAEFNNLLTSYERTIVDLLNKLKGKGYFKKLITLTHNVEQKEDDDNRLENLQHVLYKIIADNYISIRELSSYTIPAEVSIDYPKDLTESFKKSVAAVRAMNDDEKSYAWNVSLITPGRWTNGEWSESYLVKYLKAVSEKPKIDIRRIHIITKTDFWNKGNNHRLYELMITEQLFGIDNKVVVIDKSEVKRDSENIALRLKGIMLFDYALLNNYEINYYSQNLLTPRKLILCSDIVPYWLEQEDSDPSNNKVYPLKDYYTFNLFKEHFLCLWNLKEFFRLKKLNSLLENERAIDKNFFEIVFDDAFLTSFNSINLENVVKYLFPFKKCITKENLKIMLSKAFDDFFQLDYANVNLRDEFNKIFKELIIKEIKPNNNEN